jgi:hypothetical protein
MHTYISDVDVLNPQQKGPDRAVLLVQSREVREMQILQHPRQIQKRHSI